MSVIITRSIGLGWNRMSHPLTRALEVSKLDKSISNIVTPLLSKNCAASFSTRCVRQNIFAKGSCKSSIHSEKKSKKNELVRPIVKEITKVCCILLAASATASIIKGYIRASNRKELENSQKKAKLDSSFA